MLTPPSLPPFLANIFELHPVEGVPSDNEVKDLHAVIRALDQMAHVPKLYDVDLAVELSQHLFNIQMERYRNEYPCSIFPSNTTYTPPVLPEHVPFVLDPITGPPSDHQLRAVHAAWRFSESLAHVPSMFDPDLSMRLSQHLFDIQFERYLRHDASNGRLGQATHSPVNQPLRNDLEDDDNGPHLQGNSGAERKFDQATLSITATEPLQDPVPTPELVTQGTTEQPELLRPEPENNSSEHLKPGPEDTNKLLVKIEGVLENMSRVLVITQQSIARGLITTSYGGAWNSHMLTNERGEDPECLGLPGSMSLSGNLQNWGPGNDTTLARYLEFYGIGSEYIEGGSEPKIKEGKGDEAKRRLGRHLNVW